MKKTLILIFFIFFAVLSGWLLFAGHNAKIITEFSDREIYSILEKNSDAKDYMDKTFDFSIIKREILTPQSITAGQNAENFKEVYQGLALESNRYIKVDLMDKSDSKGLTAVIDFKEKLVPKAYGILLLKQ